MLVYAAPVVKRTLIAWSDRGPLRVPGHHSPRKIDDEGPILRLLREPESSDLYACAWLLCSPATASAGQTLATAMREHISQVEVHCVDVDDPSDHQQIFTALGPLVERLELERPSRAHPRDVILSAGTPQCQTMWVILVQAGLLDARMLQVIPPAFVPVPHPRAIKEVRLAFDGFPEIRAMREEIERLATAYEPRSKGVLAGSQAMVVLNRRIMRLAPTTIPALIIGETGVGKERVARALHEHSDRKNRIFVAENCGAFSEGLLAAELFGSERGAFTGATQRRRGLFEQAHGGTLFLDEVGEMDPRAQAMLLRVLQEGCLRRVGGEDQVAVDVRVIAATHRPLQELVAAGRFREDLYYRLRGAELRVPALRDREGDIPLLVEHFLNLYRGSEDLRVSARAMNTLTHYAWPGNIRELEAEVRRWTVFCRRRVDVDDLSPEITGVSPAISSLAKAKSVETLASVVETAQREAIVNALAQHQGNLVQSARALAIDRNTLKRKMARFGLKATR